MLVFKKIAHRMGRIGPGVRVGVTYGSDWARSAG